MEEGLESALKDHLRPGKTTKLSDKQAAYGITLACSDAADGLPQWILHLLADKGSGIK